MTRCQRRWVDVVIIALVVILRGPTLLPSMSLTDEDYYRTMASDILDGGKVYHTAVDTKPPGIYYIYAGVFRIADAITFLLYTFSRSSLSQPPRWWYGGLAPCG